VFINVFIIKINSHPYFPVTSSTCYIYMTDITPTPERIFILNINIVPWGRDILNLKEVVCGTLSDELKIRYIYPFFSAVHLKEIHGSKVYFFVISCLCFPLLLLSCLRSYQLLAVLCSSPPCLSSNPLIFSVNCCLSIFCQ